MGENSEEKVSTRKLGVRRGPVKVAIRPTNYKLKQVSKQEFLEIRKRDNIANKAAEEARQNSLAEQSNDDGKEVAKDVSEAESNVSQIRQSIAEVRKALSAKPKDAKLKKKLAELELKLDEAEDELENLES